MGKKNDPMVGLKLNVCVVFYTHWSDTWVTKLTPWEGRFSTCVCFLHTLARHRGNKTDHMGGSIFNMRIVFYTHWADIWVTKLTPWEGRYSTFVLFLHALERHMDNKNDPVGGPAMLHLLCFCADWNEIWVTKLTPWEGWYSTFVMFIKRVGARYG